MYCFTHSSRNLYVRADIVRTAMQNTCELKVKQGVGIVVKPYADHMHEHRIDTHGNTKLQTNKYNRVAGFQSLWLVECLNPSFKRRLRLIRIDLNGLHYYIWQQIKAGRCNRWKLNFKSCELSSRKTTFLNCLQNEHTMTDHHQTSYSVWYWAGLQSSKVWVTTPQHKYSIEVKVLGSKHQDSRKSKFACKTIKPGSNFEKVYRLILKARFKSFPLVSYLNIFVDAIRQDLNNKQNPRMSRVWLLVPN